MTPESARSVFATFAPGLQRAMRGAATRNGWAPDDWPVQVDMVWEALRVGRCSESELTEGYAKVIK
jgi:hypothetical protein